MPMNDFPKVLVVDDGTRTADHALSAELAELGYASVTTSIEATDEVLEMIPPPAAILVQVPAGRRGAGRDRFMALAERLKERTGASGIPVIIVEGPPGLRAGGFAAALQSKLGSPVLNSPER